MKQFRVVKTMLVDNGIPYEESENKQAIFIKACYLHPQNAFRPSDEPIERGDALYKKELSFLENDHRVIPLMCNECQGCGDW